MTTYQDLDWNSLNFVRNHLYRRLATPLTHALGRLAIAQHLNGLPDTGSDQEQFRRATHGLELALNLIKAWSALIHVKSGGTIQADQRRLVTPTTLPIWLLETLNMQTAFKAEHTRPIFVHPETFYESLILLSEIAAKTGTLKLLLTGDAPGSSGGIWVRAVFDPPPTGAYAGLRGLLARLDVQDPVQHEVVIQVLALEDFCAINSVEVKVQTNTGSGEQALAVYFPAAPANVVEVGQANGLVLAPLRDQRGAVIEVMSETLIVPPPGLRERLNAILDAESQPGSAAPAAAESAGPQTAPETLIVPPPDAHERITAALNSGPQTAPETLIVPPPGAHERITAALNAESHPNSAAPEPTSPAQPGDAPETLIVPPPDALERITAALDSETQPGPAVPDRVPPGSPAPEAPPAPPKSAGVEVIWPENASDTQIILPPDLQRRLLARKQAAAPDNPPKDETPPNGETKKKEE